MKLIIFNSNNLNIVSREDWGVDESLGIYEEGKKVPETQTVEVEDDFYEKYEEQLMGLTYIKNHHGPTPNIFGKSIEKLVNKGDIEAIKSKFYKLVFTRLTTSSKIPSTLA